MEIASHRIPAAGSRQAASISSAWVVGCGIVSPSSRIPCKCSATASRIRRLVSSNVRPVAIHPGRSGMWALYPVLVLAQIAVYLASFMFTILDLPFGCKHDNCGLAESQQADGGVVPRGDPRTRGSAPPIHADDVANFHCFPANRPTARRMP